jgi:hypothetical protein
MHEATKVKFTNPLFHLEMDSLPDKYKFLAVSLGKFSR